MTSVCAPTSFFNQRIPGDVPKDPQSATYVASLVAQAQATTFTLNYRDWSLTHFVAPAGTPTQKIWLDKADALEATKRKMLETVPIPPEFRPPGPFPGDNPATILDLATDTYYEFHGLRYKGVDTLRSEGEVPGCSTLNEPGWHCDNAAAVKEFSTSPGYFREGDWPGVPGTNHWGCSGSGLFLLPGSIKIAELQRGYIPHAVRLECVTRQTTPRWPAQKSDGKSSDPTQPQEGMLLKLPEASLAKVASPFVLTIARAAVDFCFVLTDGAGNVGLKGESQAMVARSQGHRPDAWLGPEDKVGGKEALLSKFPGELLAEFPLADLFVVDGTWRPPASAPGMLPKAA